MYNLLLSEGSRQCVHGWGTVRKGLKSEQVSARDIARRLRRPGEAEIKVGRCPTSNCVLDANAQREARERNTCRLSHVTRVTCSQTLAEFVSAHFELLFR